LVGPLGRTTHKASMTATGKTLVPQSLIGYWTTVPCEPQRSTWKYQKGIQSGASFPVTRPVYVTFTTVSPSRKRVRSEH